MHRERSVYAIVLAGGSGERLWPLSRRNQPKQLLALEAHQTLLEDTIERIAPVVHQDHIWVVTTQQYMNAIAALVQHKVGIITLEPSPRNTAPAILLACFSIYAQDPEALVVVLPSDHYIPARDTFIEFVTHALDCATQTDRIVMLGAQPTYPATGYGYIEYNPQQSYPCDVIKFHEKPSLAVAQAYLHSGRMLWNIGIFCAQVQVLLEEFEQLVPDVYKTVRAYWIEGQPYEQVPAIAVDYAIMEKSARLAVLPANFVWYDVGNLNSYLSLRSHYKKFESEIIAVDSHNNLIEVQHDLVALIGVDNLCIVQVDGILLIAKRDETEKVKQVLETLRQHNADEYL